MQMSVRDLGETRYVTLLGRSMTTLQAVSNARSYGHQTPPFVSASKRFQHAPKRLTRYWTQPLNLSEENSKTLADQLWAGQYGATLRAFMVVFVMHLSLPLLFSTTGKFPLMLFGMFFPILWSLIIGGMLLSPRHQFKMLSERNLTVEEVEALLPTARGRLERQYFGLVLDALKTEIPTESAKSDIRLALRHLGDLIARLPSDPVSVPDADALRREAQELRQQARQESDAFIEGSLLRQAETIEERATLSAQNGRAARRVAMLRREARQQMDNLRAVLVGFQQNPAMDSANVSHLTAALQRVAGEAKSVALANRELENEELERLYGSPLPPLEAQAVAVPAAPAAVQMVGNSTSGTTTQPTPSRGNSTRPWWRNNGSTG